VDAAKYLFLFFACFFFFLISRWNSNGKQ